MMYRYLCTEALIEFCFFFRTYKNLEKRVILECDGEAIPLPSLQVRLSLIAGISRELANLSLECGNLPSYDVRNFEFPPACVRA